MSVYPLTPDGEVLLYYGWMLLQRFGEGMLATEEISLPAGGTVATGLRDYSPGDDLRRVDWGICARHDELRVREYAGMARQNAYLLVDGSSAMLVGKTTREARNVAALMLAYGLLAQNRTLECGIFAGESRWLPPILGKERIGIVAKWLEETPLAEETVDFSRLVEHFLPKKRPAGDIFLVSDFLGENETFVKNYADGLLRLRAGGYAPRIVQLVLAENHLAGRTGDVEIVDPRGYRQVVTITEGDANRYEKMYQEYLAGIREFCHSRQIPWTRVENDVLRKVWCLQSLGISPQALRNNPWGAFLSASPGMTPH
ncbi:MAG: DUF58 domain-containing protein [Planctomycetia bacterium]|nr:DUF58 domain-containing protein [Planctomycetia bacterium]